ncbi:DMT family transporter [Pyrococcus abyssi]|uniref:DMT family permease n=1 Tax=Pyrococcus abyssi (strain GE5 / Orsay) TaxID=272844 RepID=Q9V0W2_PYRAB|nr:DMT family transporter [Pyrococcus abyssi]CAB49591.1 Predicted permease [Pyrococcus abyssi GE5]CCE70063.1 TPA: DMT family permease [Pyrococcus abyssi GE5]
MRLNIYAILSILLWSTVASAFKLTLSRLDPISLLFYSSLTSSLIFLVANLVRGNPDWKSISKNRESAILGFVNPLFYYLVLFTAYSRLPAQEAQALNYTWPILLVVLSSYFLGQRLTLKEIGGVIVGFIGILIVGTRGNLSSLRFSDPVGDGLAISSALLFAVYWVMNVNDKRPPEVKMFWNFAFGTLYLLPNIPRIKFDLLGLLGAIYIGLFEMGVTYLLWLKALETDKAGKVASMVYLTPVLSLFFISTVVGEKIMLSTLVGLSLILLGIFISQKR